MARVALIEKLDPISGTGPAPIPGEIQCRGSRITDILVNEAANQRVQIRLKITGLGRLSDGVSFPVNDTVG